jgi:hypothetical protein
MKTKSLKENRCGLRLFQPVPLASLVKAPLKELFWGLPESSLANDAQQRIEAMLSNAAASVSEGPSSALAQLCPIQVEASLGTPASMLDPVAGDLLPAAA